MFHQTDKEEELKRLEQELLETEEPEAPSEEYLEPTAVEDAPEGEAPRVYRNFSNNYGKDLRNFASDYRTYTADDDDAEELNRETPESDRFKNRSILIFLLILLSAVVIAGAALLIRFGGIL